MIRPWHKSPLFYLGLFGLAFIVWAWIDSCYHWTHLYTGSGKPGTAGYHHTYANHKASRVTIVHTHYPYTAPHPSEIGIQASRLPETDSNWWFPLPDYEYQKEGLIGDEPTGEEPQPGEHYLEFLTVHLPHWLIVLAYLALWSLLLFWRSRRIKRLSRLKISA